MKKLIMMIIVTITMVSAVFADTKVKVHCEEGDIVTYIASVDDFANIDRLDNNNNTTDDDITFDKYIEADIEYVQFRDGTILCIDNDFKHGTWASEATEMVKDNLDIYVSAVFKDVILSVLPYKGHIITMSVPREKLEELSR